MLSPVTPYGERTATFKNCSWATGSAADGDETVEHGARCQYQFLGNTVENGFSMHTGVVLAAYNLCIAVGKGQQPYLGVVYGKLTTCRHSRHRRP